MKLLRVLCLALFVLSLTVGCGPKRPDTDPAADDLSLPQIDNGGNSDKTTEPSAESIKKLP